MKLIKNGIVVEPDWRFHDKGENSDQLVNQIVSVDLFLKNLELSTAIEIDVDVDLDDIAPHLSQLELIVIKFEGYADGRGFSIAHRLRHSFGFRGDIWGSGSLISDQYAMALQCGIDAVLVDEKLLQRQPIEHWQGVIVNAPAPYRFQDDMMRDSVDDVSIIKLEISDEYIDELNTRFEKLPTHDLFDFVLSQNNMGTTAVVSSFGAESAVLLHLISKTTLSAPVLFLDTGKHFLETLQYQIMLAKELGLTNVKILRPETAMVERHDPQGSLWQSDSTSCCILRKINPLRQALAGYDSWISGRKTYQNDMRSSLDLFEHSGNHIKINPLANWSREQLSRYMQTHNLPAHPLVAKGYASIGCATCTSPVHHGENARAGRWRGTDKTECGIHFVDGKIARRQKQSA